MMEFEPLTLGDLPFLLEIRNECRECLHDNREFTLLECERWFRETAPDFHRIRHEGELIGYFRLSNYNSAQASIYVGADLHQRYRGRGLGYQAYETFLPILKQRYQLEMVCLEVLSHNTPAHQLYLKLGFREIDRRAGIASRNGGLVDSIVMSKSL